MKSQASCRREVDGTKEEMGSPWSEWVLSFKVILSPGRECVGVM